MDLLNWMLLALAAAIFVFVWVYREVKTANGKYIPIGPIGCALASALVAIVLVLQFGDFIIRRAAGDKGWADDGLVRWLLALGAIALLAGWGYWFYRRQFKKVDSSDSTESH